MKIGVYFLHGNGRGDALLLSAALRQLRNHYPRANIQCALQHCELLKYNPTIDKIYEKTHDNTAVFHELYKHSDLNYFVDYHTQRHRLFSHHICDILCELCDVKPNRKLEIYLDSSEQQFAHNVITTIKNENRGKHIVAIHNSASTPNREMFNTFWQDLVNKMPEIHFIQLGGSDDSALAGVQSLIGKLSIRETVACVGLCDAIVAVDSFLNHAAAVMNTPGVILFGSSDPIAFGHDMHHNVIARHVECVPCYRPVVWAGDLMPDPSQPEKLVPWKCSHRQCMQEIKVETVQQLLEKQLDK